MNYSVWYQKKFHELTSGGVALRGAEIGTMELEEFERRSTKVLISRLSTYIDVGDSFTHSFLYELAAGHPEIAPDLSYLPFEKDARLMDEDLVPWLLGSQSKNEGKDFHLIGFSNSVVQELVNIPVLLKKSGIPISKKERMQREDIPLVILGGANAPWTQILWHEDSWVDGIFLGENPECIKEIFSILAQGKKKNLTKGQILEQMSSVDGFFLPAKTSTAKKNRYCHNDAVKTELCSKGIVPYGEDFLSQAPLHISEGCRGFCSFCAENWSRKPYVEFSREKLLQVAFDLKKNRGASKVNLFSFNFNMYAELEPLLLDLIENFNSIGLKSQRFDMLAEHPELLEIEKLIGKMNLSAGLEGISTRMRAYLNKNLSEKDFLRSLSLIFRMKAQEVKIFMIATGKEEEADFDEFANLLQKIAKEKQLAFAHTRLVFSVTPLVRFTGTPLEFDSCPTLEEIRKSVRKIERVVEQTRFEVRSAMECEEYLFSQILVRGQGPQYCEALLELIEKFSFVYYSEIPAPLVSCFVQFLEQKELPLEKIFAGKIYDDSNDVPLDMGIKRDFLWRTFLKNSAYEEIGSLDVIKKKIAKKFNPILFKNKLASLKLREQNFSFHVSWNDELQGRDPEYRGQILAAALMQADERLVPFYRDFVESYWKDEKNITGDDFITLKFFKEAQNILESLTHEQLAPKFKRWGKFYGFKNAAPKHHEFSFAFDEKPQLDPYLKGEGLKHTLLKRDGKSCFEFSKDSLKKDKVKSLVLGETLDLVPGKKFDLHDFLRKSFVGAGKNDWKRSVVRGKLNFS